MNAFKQGQSVELRALEELLPFLEGCALEGRLILTQKGQKSKFIQKNYGDIVFQDKNHNMVFLEIKAEEENKYGNFFLETWSNKSRGTLGWMYTQKCDYLLYFFIKEKQFYLINFQKLFKWAFCDPGLKGAEYPGRIFDFKEKPQDKYQQLNDTWGRCVPIKTMQEEVGFKFHQLGNTNGTLNGAREVLHLFKIEEENLILKQENQILQDRLSRLEHERDVLLEASLRQPIKRSRVIKKETNQLSMFNRNGV